MVLVCSGIFTSCSIPASTPVTQRAAIIDQLSDTNPNLQFTDEVTYILKKYGLEVNLYQTKEVNIGLYRKLAIAGYKVIIFRTHSGALRKEGEGQLLEGTYILTSEPYNRAPENDPYVFATGSKFVTRSIEGKFPGTVVIMMGCATIYKPDLAAAFIAKGASSYMGWNASLDLSYADRANISLVGDLFSCKLTVDKAIQETRADAGIESVYKARLKYRPEHAGIRTIAELIR